MPRYSVVIRAYNEEKHIGRLLTGLLCQTERDIEVLLVDSGSTDATCAIASRYPVRVLHFPRSDFTFGRSLNFGIRQATGDVVVIASAHVYPIYDDWISRLVEPLAAADIALTYGRQRGNESTRYSEHRVFAKWFPEHSVARQKHPFCNNANAAIRRSVWQSLPYDEQLTGLEDVDWARRALGLGFGIAYCAAAEVVHVHEETPARIYNRYRREALAMRDIFPQEHFRFRDFLRLYAVNVASDCYHAAHDGRLWSEASDIATFRLMQFWGTYRGYRRSASVTNELREKFYYPSGTRRLSVAPTGHAIDYSDTETPGLPPIQGRSPSAAAQLAAPVDQVLEATPME